MGLVSGFQDGLLFVSDLFFWHQGAYRCAPKRPCVCDKCQSRSRSFHAHGRYRRWVKTMRKFALTSVRVWRHRWLCLCCGRTMITGPPDVLPHIPLCTLLIVALLWGDLDGEKGIHNAFPSELEHTVGARTLARYLKRAKALCLKTQQAIREVLIEQKEPRPREECFRSGLFPPPSLYKRHREPSPAAKLWRALSMLLQGSHYIRFHLERAEGPNELFSEGAVQLVFHLAKGLPRVINQIALQTLIRAAIRKVDKIDETFLKQQVLNGSLFDTKLKE